MSLITHTRMSAAGLFSSSSAFFSSPEFLSLDDSDLLPLDAPDFDQVSLPGFSDLRNSYIVSLLTSLVHITLPLLHHDMIHKQIMGLRTGKKGAYGSILDNTLT